MTRDRSYSTHEEYIFHMCGVESWTELWERAPEIELMQALMAEGLVGEVVLRRKMVKEQVLGAENRSMAIREMATKIGISIETARRYVYR